VLNYADTLTQPVAIPPGVTRLTLTFWRQVRSNEPTGNSDDTMGPRFCSVEN